LQTSEGIARSKGTSVFLKNLFSPLPVRHQEFVKTARKQYFQSIEMIQAYCLAFPLIRFTVSNTIDGKRTIPVKSTGTGSLLSTFASLFGASSNTNLVDIDFSLKITDKNESWGCTCKGLISKPKPLCGRGDTCRQFFYVNKMPIDIPKLSKLVNQLYHDFNANQFPALVFFLTLPLDRLGILSHLK
jgi:DNA mismatch repair protein PMS2